MKTILHKLATSAGLAAGISLMAGTPAFGLSITNPSVSGIAGTDYYLYKVVGNQTVRDDSTPLSTILQGSCDTAATCAPGGNVELFANSEQLNNADFNSYNKVTSLTGTIGGKNITLSSLTAADWNSTVSGGMTLGEAWFNSALNANGLSSVLGNQTLYNNLWQSFNINNGRQRFSDPNISYVNQDATTNLIKIGLAGHYDATNLLLAGLTPNEQLLFNSMRDPNKASLPIQASEIVKYNYNGISSYLYSFNATPSGLSAADDGISHTGNYELLLAGLPVEKVPEPSLLIGLIGVGGLLFSKRQARRLG